MLLACCYIKSLLTLNHRYDDAVLIAQLCPTLCDTMDCSPPGSPRQEYWSELPFPSPGDLPDSGIEPRFPALQEDSLPSKPQVYRLVIIFQTKVIDIQNLSLNYFITSCYHLCSLGCVHHFYVYGENTTQWCASKQYSQLHSQWWPWSGLPFPSPLHESEKWKWSCSVVSDS